MCGIYTSYTGCQNKEGENMRWLDILFGGVIRTHIRAFIGEYIGGVIYDTDKGLSWIPWTGFLRTECGVFVRDI